LKKTIALTLITFMLFLTLHPSNAQLIRTAKSTILGAHYTDTGLKGVTASLQVELHNGSGRVFVDTMPLTEIDTQASARLAQEVACDMIEEDCSKYDFIYIIRSDTPMVGGPSAGTAMAVTTLSVLLNIPLGENVMITGTINPDGTVGPVGGIVEKAEAAFKAGADLMLIPYGQSIVNVERAEVTQIGPITQTIITTEPLNISEYAETNWGLKIVEVRTLKQAFELATNYRIEKKAVSSEEVASELYSGIMKGMAESLIQRFADNLTRVKEEFESATLGFSTSEEINKLITSQEERLSQTQELYDKESYYSAASFAVSGLVSIEYAHNLINYYQTNSQKVYANTLLDAAFKRITFTEQEFMKPITIDNVNDIEVILVSLDRLRETEDLVDAGYKEFYNGEYKNAIYYASYANIRELTAHHWFNLTNEFTGDENILFNVTRLKTLIQKRLEEASNALTYAKTVSNNAFLASAEQHLNKALEAYDEGKLVFALFEALKSRAESNLAMETRGMTNETLTKKVEDDINEARLSIKDAEEAGLLPLLAISYLEYSEAFAEDPAQRLTLLTYSKQFSKLSKNIVEPMRINATTSILPEASYEIVPITCDNEISDLGSQVMLLIAGIAIGIIFSLLKFT